MGWSVVGKLGKGESKRLKYNLLSFTCQKAGILNAQLRCNGPNNAKNEVKMGIQTGA